MACFERVWESAKPWFGEEVCVGRVEYWNDPAAPKPNSLVPACGVLAADDAGSRSQ
jgi:hypothetical protein